MKEFGYLYVLANSAMPNMVKVGKTTRSSLERAEELSKATGLPTPFIVVYEQLFADCGAAESFVHVYLEEKGYRVADNREFFNAPVSIVVKAIALAPNAIDKGSASQINDKQYKDDLLEQNDPDELDDLFINEPNITYPWENIFTEAEAHYKGDDDYIVDYTEAMRLFRQAAKLGSIPAYAYIAKMYKNGESVRQDNNKALQFFKEGARKGSVYCYWEMGLMFLLKFCQEDNETDFESSEKCFSLFIKNMPNKIPDDQYLTEGEILYIFSGCIAWIIALIKENVIKRFPPSMYKFIAENPAGISNLSKLLCEDGSSDYIAEFFESLV